MNENYDIRTPYDIQTPLLSSSLLEEVDQSKFSCLEESGAESTSRYQEVHRSKNRSDSAESFLRHSPSPMDSINDVHQTSFTANRLLPRDAPFYQSKGNWNIYHRNRFHHHNGSDSHQDTVFGNHYFGFSWVHRIITHYICVDWFHSLLYSPTPVIFLIVFLLYVSVVLIFAALYLNLPKFFDKSQWSNTASSPACHMDMKNYLEAIYFSTSTMSTIGYGVSDYYFNDCIVPLVLMLLQIFLSLAINAVAFGLLFLRLSTSRKRRRTLLFSNKAVIARFQNDLYFMVRIAELATKRHLIHCQVKCYCVQHTRQYNASMINPIPDVTNMYGQHPEQQLDASTAIETSYFQVFDMKLQPGIHQGTFLLMALPTVIAHKIDSSSPLMPPAEWYDENGVAHSWDIGVMEESTKNNHHKNSFEAKKTNTSFERERKEIEDFLCDRDTEIVVIVEGIDEMTCSPLQAKQSYKFNHGDILWEHTFAPCVRSSSKSYASKGDRGSTNMHTSKAHCVVDFQKFHHVIPIQLHDHCTDKNQFIASKKKH